MEGKCAPVALTPALGPKETLKSTNKPTHRNAESEVSSLTSLKDQGGIAKGVLGFQATRLLPPGSVSWCSWAKVSHAGRL
ncbi:hypothetical protein QQF64_030740 [Cirrhinus molitorella]|uniref:Uncharacterized protein n=1 Tax=Cirrhinus molitorella TaxID=172907 RepID=A0ABR3N464_9TELE